MNYSIRITNIQGRVNVVKALRVLNPGMSLLEAKNYVWEKDTVNLSAIRKERHPELYESGNDYVFDETERAYIQGELRGVATVIIDQIPLAAELEQKQRLRKTLSFAASWALKRIGAIPEGFCKLSAEELDELEENFKEFVKGGL